MAFSQRVRAQEHHRASRWNGKRVPDSDGVGPHQIDLQLANLITSDSNIAEFSHACGDRVSNFVGRDDFIDDRSGVINRFSCIRRQKHRSALIGDFTYSFERQIVSVNVQCVQEFPIEDYFPAAARKTVKYLTGKAATFIFESVTMCVVSPSASKVPFSARASS